jgi:hypothetical protein
MSLAVPSRVTLEFSGPDGARSPPWAHPFHLRAPLDPEALGFSVELFFSLGCRHSLTSSEMTEISSYPAADDENAASFATLAAHEMPSFPGHR